MREERSRVGAEGEAAKDGGGGAPGSPACAGGGGGGGGGGEEARATTGRRGRNVQPRREGTGAEISVSSLGLMPPATLLESVAAAAAAETAAAAASAAGSGADGAVVTEASDEEIDGEETGGDGTCSELSGGRARPRSQENIWAHARAREIEKS